ncbi:MAG: hypothetical protein H3C47_02615 [Candidatus Cloacimonetes bacterium]|nr:hypothetical protein [Candidatus Cloacimonadota bacterium]
MAVVLTRLFLSDTFLHNYPLGVFESLSNKTLEGLKDKSLILSLKVYQETQIEALKQIKLDNWKVTPYLNFLNQCEKFSFDLNQDPANVRRLMDSYRTSSLKVTEALAEVICFANSNGDTKIAMGKDTAEFGKNINGMLIRAPDVFKHLEWRI